jgi:hypothetical protein
VNIDLTAPWIDAVEIWGPGGRVLPVNGQYPVRVGVRYLVALHIDPGNGQYTAGVEVNPSLQVPPSLNVVNRVGSTGHVRITEAHTRRYAFTPSEPGSFPLGFRMRDINPPQFNTSGRHASVGYFYSRGYVTSEVNADNTDYETHVPDGAPADPGPIEPALTQPLLTVVGTAIGQRFGIVPSEADFLATSSRQWRQVGSPSFPIWDVAPRNGVSDVDYALQCAPVLTQNGFVIGRGVYDSGTYYQLAWARTAVGVAAGILYLVVADGEGVNGGHGATLNQLGEFFRDELGATSAMNFDGGLSSEMVLRSTSGPRRVTTITGEDSSWDIDPFTTVIRTADGGPGSVFNYLRAGGS